MQSVQTGFKGRKKPSRLAVGLLTTVFAVGLAGCDSLLDVDNPNNVVQSDLENPEAVSALVNGALALTSSSLANVALSTAAMSDELLFTGSQNWAAELDRGIFDTPSGRSDAITDALAQARWTADEALALAAEVGATDYQLMRANLFSGLVHMTIADVMEDFAFSDRTDVGPPVGEANMQDVYDTAISRLETALSLSPPAADDLRIRAALARAHWARDLWTHMQGAIPADPNAVDPSDYLIDNAAAVGYAEDVIGTVGATDDWAYTLGYAPASGSNPQGAWINERQEFVFSETYVTIDNSGKAVRRDSADVDNDGITTNERDITLLDPIDNIPDQGAQQIITDFVENLLYAPLRVVTARELHLILAEAALENGVMIDFQTHINHVRALKSQDSPLDHTPWSMALAGTTHPTAIEMLFHERQANLINMPNRRLWDMYRSGVHGPEWGNASSAVLNPGQVLVIGQGERVSNCFILGNC